MKTYFRGVINGSLTFDESLNVYIEGLFSYENIEEIKCYDENGNFLFTHEKKTYTGEEKKDRITNVFSKNKIYKSVFQTNFNFRFIETFNSSTFDELNKYNWGNLGYELTHTEEFNEYDKQYRINHNYPVVEHCMFGSKKYSIVKKYGKNIINFDYKKYKSNKDNFIKNNPEYKEETEYIFKQNLRLLSEYFMCTVTHLKSDKFNIRESFIKRLNKKINSYDTSKRLG
jgi:hypothetical protein